MGLMCERGHRIVDLDYSPGHVEAAPVLQNGSTDNVKGFSSVYPPTRKSWGKCSEEKGVSDKANAECVVTYVSPFSLFVARGLETGYDMVTRIDFEWDESLHKAGLDVRTENLYFKFNSVWLGGFADDFGGFHDDRHGFNVNMLRGWALVTSDAEKGSKVYHWDQKLDGDPLKKDDVNYSLRDGLDDGVWVYGDFKEYVQCPVISKEGFIDPPEQRLHYDELGETEVNYYYVRNNYDVNLIKGTGIDSVTGENINSTTGRGAYLYEQDVTVSASLKDGYTFDNWTNSKGEVVSTDQEYTFKMPAENVSLTANASKESYLQQVQIRYEKPDGTFTDWEDVINEKRDYGSTVSWGVVATDEFQAASIESYTVSEAKKTQVTIYRKKFKVTVDNTTGISSTTGEKEYRVGEKVSVSATEAKGYTWTGWTSSQVEGSTNKTYEFTMPSRAVTVTAHATINTYTIKYNLNEGTITGEKTEYTVETENFTLVKPTRVGYTFKGWSINNGEPQIDVTINKGSIGNRTYTANWQANMVGYRVRHWIQKLDGIAQIKTDQHYTLQLDDTSKTGLTDSKVIPEVETFTGFTPPPEEERRE